MKADLYCRETIANVANCVDSGRGTGSHDIVERAVQKARSEGTSLDNERLTFQLYLYRMGFGSLMDRFCAEFLIGRPSYFPIRGGPEVFSKENIRNVLAHLCDVDGPMPEAEVELMVDEDIQREWIRPIDYAPGDYECYELGYEQGIWWLCYAFGIEPWTWELLEGDNTYEFQYHLPIFEP